ncbi:hypothetical protein EJB05_24359, partial [Eragrostis curvula]
MYYVLTVGSSAEPRCIGLPADSPSIERFNMVGLTYMGNRSPVLLRSCLHWGRWTLENQLIVFDTIAESFRCMRSPITCYHWARSRLIEMDGVLGFSHLDETESVVDLWVLHDYELEVWLFKYRIELPQVQLRSIAKANRWYWYFYGLIVSDNGDLTGDASSPEAGHGRNKTRVKTRKHHVGQNAMIFMLLSNKRER